MQQQGNNSQTFSNNHKFKIVTMYKWTNGCILNKNAFFIRKLFRYHPIGITIEKSLLSKDHLAFTLNFLA